MESRNLSYYKSVDTCCHNLTKQLSHYLYFFSFSFSFGLTGRSVGKCHMTNITHIQDVMSHDGHGKIVHRPYSSCISSIQKIDKDSIEFFLSTGLGVGLSCLG